jgi:hypothetical protein
MAQKRRFADGAAEGLSDARLFSTGGLGMAAAARYRLKFVTFCGNLL